MAFFSAFAALHANRPAFLGDVAQLIAFETSPRIAVVMVMVSQTIQTFLLLALFNAIFSYVAAFSTAETLDKVPLFLLALFD
jgi:hypothetical protein